MNTAQELANILRIERGILAAMQRGNALHSGIARQLRATARDAARRRGHTLRQFSPLLPLGRGGYSDAACSTCGAGVRIETAPAPNSIDIAGAAVAVGCGRV